MDSIQRLMPTFDPCQDFFRIGGPDNAGMCGELLKRYAFK